MQPFAGQRQAPVPVACHHVDAREVEHDIGLSGVEHGGQMRGERLHVGGVGSAIGQGHVVCGGRLLERIVFGAVHREGVHIGHIGKECGIAVALMHIQIHDADAPDPAGLLKYANGHSHIVKHAEPLAVAGHCVMCAACEVSGDSVFERHHRGVDGALHRHARPVDQPLRPRQPHAALGPLRQ